MSTTISIIICTKDRAESLRETVDSIGRTKMPAGLTVELLIIDNGSTDHTERVARAVDIPEVLSTYIREPRVGKSHAYNTGIFLANGKIILCTDDDVRVPANWIEGMCTPILEGKADAVAGGVIFPSHIKHLLGKSLADRRHGWVASTRGLDSHHPSRMVGANMAFHRRVLEKVPGFDIELGPGPEALGTCEETLFSWQLLEAGYKLIGAFDIAVEHHFDIKRLTAEGLIDFARNLGRSHAYVFHHWQHHRSRLVIPRLILCHLHRFFAKYLVHFKSKIGRNITDKELQLEQDLAFYREYIVQRRRKFKFSLRGLALQHSLSNAGSRMPKEEI
jgi:glycosyltransferase involved in cell wall biosynthesis